MKYIKGLDTIRAVAILLVVFDHWNDRLPSPESNSFSGIFQNLIIPTGTFGVDLFFVLSGFLITSILLKEKESYSPLKTIVKNFFFRRALRIFPIYYLSIAILFALNYPDIRADILWLLSYTENINVYRHHDWNAFSHAWSLSVEEQFYLVWPWVVLLVTPRFLKHTMMFFIAVGIVSKLWVYKMEHGFDYLLVFNCFDAFGIGSLYAYASLPGNRMMRFSKYLTLLLPISIAAYFYWKFAVYFHYVEHLNFLSRTVNAIIAIALIHYVIHLKSTKMKAAFENKSLIWIGTISYGLYLYHYPIDFVYDLYSSKLSTTFAPVFTNYYIAYAIKLALLFGLAQVSYKYFEKPMLSLKKKFAYSKTEATEKKHTKPLLLNQP